MLKINLIFFRLEVEPDNCNEEFTASLGAQIVSVPASLATQSANHAWQRVLWWLAAGYGVVFLFVNLGVFLVGRRAG
jgi:hypothetical protein